MREDEADEGTMANDEAYHQCDIALLQLKAYRKLLLAKPDPQALSFQYEALKAAFSAICDNTNVWLKACGFKEKDDVRAKLLN